MIFFIFENRKLLIIPFSGHSGSRKILKKKIVKKKVKGTLHYFFCKKKEYLFWTNRIFFQTFLPIYDHLGPKKKNEDFFFLF